MEANPYRELLGEAWSRLSPGALLAHTIPVSASGKFGVRHGRGLVRRLLARLLRLPPAGDGKLVRVALRREGERVRWIRSFDEHQFETLQWRSGDVLIEQFGANQMIFRIRQVDGQLVYEQIGAKWRGVSVPMEMRVAAVASDSSDGWHVDVSVRVWPFGKICSYGGDLSIG
jgi:hypothetical protein